MSQRPDRPTPAVRGSQGILSLSAGEVNRICGYGYGYAQTYLPTPESPVLSPALASMLMPLVARTGRCFLRPLNEPDNLLPLAWDDGGPWNFVLELQRGETACTSPAFSSAENSAGGDISGRGQGRSGNHERPRGTSRRRCSDRMDYRSS